MSRVTQTCTRRLRESRQSRRSQQTRRSPRRRIRLGGAGPKSERYQYFSTASGSNLPITQGPSAADRPRTTSHPSPRLGCPSERPGHDHQRHPLVDALTSPGPATTLSEGPATTPQGGDRPPSTGWGRLSACRRSLSGHARRRGEVRGRAPADPGTTSGSPRTESSLALPGTSGTRPPAWPSPRPCRHPSHDVPRPCRHPSHDVPRPCRHPSHDR